jgi:hypothetical protein
MSETFGGTLQPGRNTQVLMRPRRSTSTARLVSWVGFVTFLIVVAGMILFLGGCASMGGKSNSQQYQLAAQSYRLTVDAVTGLSRANLIDLDDLERFDRARSMADALLTRWHETLITGGSFDGLDAINALLDEMIRIQLTSEGAARDGPAYSVRNRYRRYQTRRHPDRHDQQGARGRPRSHFRRNQPARSGAFTEHRQLPG